MKISSETLQTQINPPPERASPLDSGAAATDPEPVQVKENYIKAHFSSLLSVFFLKHVSEFELFRCEFGGLCDHLDYLGAGGAAGGWR